MRILIAHNNKIPAIQYGGTERVIWYLGKALIQLGHKVAFLVPKGSYCPFADVFFLEPSINIQQQIPSGFDIVHAHFFPNSSIEQPHLFTMHGNKNSQEKLPKQTVFVSANHAKRFGSNAFVYNGLDWSEYGKPNLKNGSYYHFLGDAAWRIKNVKGAIKIATQIPNKKMHVLGGTRLNLRMGFRLTLSRKIIFHGMVGGEQKNKLLYNSIGMIFPVLWHEPFGLAIIETMYFGGSVWGTPYGSLPELVHKENGFLANNAADLIAAIQNYGDTNRAHCHQYAEANFNHMVMAQNYLTYYQKILNNEPINPEKPFLQELQNVKFLDFNS